MKNKILSIATVLLMLVAGLGATSCDTLKPPPGPGGLKHPPAPSGAKPPSPPQR